MKQKRSSFAGTVWTFLTIFLFGLILLVLGIRLYQMGYLNPEGRSLPVYEAVPDFGLTERSGKTVTNQDLKGKVWVADVIFTRCAGQCPMMSLKMQKLAKELPNISFVSLTTDPDYDSPQVLSVYAGWYEADPEQWLFLTGSKEALSAVTTGFKMNKINDPAIHSDRFVLVDKQGRMRGFYDSNDDAAMKQLAKDARLLLKR